MTIGFLDAVFAVFGIANEVGSALADMAPIIAFFMKMRRESIFLFMNVVLFLCRFIRILAYIK